MATLSDDILTKVSTEAAEHFIETYYMALQTSRHTISSYYVPNETLPDGKKVPIIIWNGNPLEDGQAVQKMYQDSMPFTHFDVQSFDCDVLNPTAILAPSDKPKDAEKCMSIFITVNGYVRLEEASKGPMKGFSESFVLAPNPDRVAAKNARGDRKGWLIQNQNFRYVVEME